VPKVENFAPELIEVWKKAPFQIEFTDEAAAIHFRFRLYSLRTALGNSTAENHRSIWLGIAKMKISKMRKFDTIKKKTIYVLNIYNADKEYQSVMDQIGVSIPEPPDLD
jgi:hypothetical protein